VDLLKPWSMCSTLCLRFSAVSFIVGILPISFSSCLPTSILSAPCRYKGSEPTAHASVQIDRAPVMWWRLASAHYKVRSSNDAPLDGHNPGTIVRHSVDGVGSSIASPWATRGEVTQGLEACELVFLLSKVALA
jgi:hypothetical protein